MNQKQRVVRDNEVPRLLELLKDRGYEIIQCNGQRRYGPMQSSNVLTPPQGSEVFVGRLPRDCFEDELVPFMEKVGKVYELRLMMNFTGFNRGFAFVTYHSPGDAARATIELNGTELRRGHAVGVVKSGNNCRLFVGGLPKTKTKEEIKRELSLIVEGVTQIFLYSSLADKAKNRGFAFVEFDTHKNAAVARRRMMSGKLKLWGRPIAVDWAEPEFAVDENVMSKVKVLHVRNLMADTPEMIIKRTFHDFAEVPVVKVKKIRDFAFVHFRTREDAEIALNALNGIELDGAQIEVSWAKPVNKYVYQLHKKMTQNLYHARQARRMGNDPQYMDSSVPRSHFSQPQNGRNAFFNCDGPNSAAAQGDVERHNQVAAHGDSERRNQVPHVMNNMNNPLPINNQTPLPPCSYRLPCTTERVSSYYVASSCGNGQCRGAICLRYVRVRQSIMVSSTISTACPVVVQHPPPTGYFVAQAAPPQFQPQCLLHSRRVPVSLRDLDPHDCVSVPPSDRDYLD